MRLRVFLLVSCLILGHLVLRTALGFGKAAPDLFIVALLVGSRTLGVGAGAGLGFVLGVLEDTFSMRAFGANALAMTLVGALGAKSRDFFVGDSTGFLVTFLLLGTWARDLLAWVVTDASIRPAFQDHLVIEAPLLALYTTVVGLAARSLFLRRRSRR